MRYKKAIKGSSNASYCIKCSLKPKNRQLCPVSGVFHYSSSMWMQTKGQSELERRGRTWNSGVKEARGRQRAVRSEVWWTRQVRVDSVPLAKWLISPWWSGGCSWHWLPVLPLSASLAALSIMIKKKHFPQDHLNGQRQPENRAGALPFAGDCNVTPTQSKERARHTVLRPEGQINKQTTSSQWQVWHMSKICPQFSVFFIPGLQNRSPPPHVLCSLYSTL